MVDEWLIGVRGSTKCVDAELAAGLAYPQRSADGVPDNYSLLVYEKSHGPHRLHTLYVGHQPLWRSRSMEPLLGILGDELEDFQLRRRDDLLVLKGVALTAGDVAVLLPEISRRPVVDQRRRLAATGFRIHPGSLVAVDPQTAELIVARGTDRVDGMLVPAGRYEIAGWGVLGASLVEVGAADAVGRWLPNLANMVTAPAVAMRALAGAVARSRRVGVTGWSETLLAEVRVLTLGAHAAEPAP